MKRTVAERIPNNDDNWRVPGLWEHTAARHREEVARGDARLLGDEDNQIIIAYGTAAGAQRALDAMSRGEPQEIQVPSRHLFPESREIPWLADRSVIRVFVYPDDRVEPAAWRDY